MFDTSVTVPLKLFTLETVTVETAQFPSTIERLEGTAERVKSGAPAFVLKFAVTTLSGSGVPVPLAIVTQVVVPETELFEQPV